MDQQESKGRHTEIRSSKLDGRDRTARKARNIVWEQSGSFICRAWKPLLGLLTIPFLIALIYAMWLLRGPVRWLFIGAAGASSVWLVVLITTLWSGIAPTIMGIEGEGFTLDVLSKFKGAGWHLINGMRFPESGDIDHILVGPPGIFIFETKWSSVRWPMKGEKRSYITNQLNWAISQVKKNRDDLRSNIKSVQSHIPMYAICVLWSAVDSSGDAPSFQLKSPDYVFGVRGSELENWLNEPRRDILDANKVEMIASELSKMALDLDAESDETYRRNLTKIMVDSFLMPILGFMAPLWTVGLLSAFKNGWVVLGGLVILWIVGLLIRHRTRLRIVILCWFMSLGGIVVYLLSHEIHVIMRRR